MRRFEEENIKKKRLEEVKIHTKAFFSFPDIVGTSSSATATAVAVVARPSFSRKNFHENKAFFQEKAGRRRLLLTAQWCCVSVAVLLLEVWKNDH